MNESHDTGWPARTQALRIGEVEIDLRYRRVRRPDGEVELPHRIFELLLLLAAEPHVVHARGDLLQRVWPGLVVEDANLSQSVWALRKALGEAHKDWIRTVSKRGYVFEPPLPIQAVACGGETVAPDPPPAAVATASGEAGRQPTPRVRRWRWHHLAAAVVLAVLVGMGIRLQAEPAPGEPAAVALIEVDDPSLAPAAKMPAALLHAWLEWKLGSLPELAVLSQAELAARPPASSVVVLLSSGVLPDDPARIFVQARVETSDGPRRVQYDGTPAQVATLVDRASADVLALLAPERAGQAWPVLRADPDTAQRYVEFRRARQAREWIRAAALGQDLVKRAPGFALGRLQLSQTLGTLAQLPPALEQLDAARVLLKPLPDDVAQVLAAQRLALSPDHAGAAAAYGALSKRFPAQPAFAIQYARALGRTGRFANAQAVLLAHPPSPTWSTATRLQWLTVRARQQISLGDSAAARATAAAAVKLTELAGAGWTHERGQALMLLADAQGADGLASTATWERAAARLAEAGDTFSSLNARFAGEITGPYRGPLVHLDAWLAQTRAAGQRQQELYALRGAAFHYFRAGDLVRYRERLQQATTVAQAMNDQLGIAFLEVDALNDDFLRGRHADIEARLAQLRRKGLQGELAMWALQFEGLVASDRGQYTRALRVLDQAEQQARAGRGADAPPPSTAAMFACTRGGVLLSQARGMEARAQYARCAAGKGSLALVAQVGLAELELMSGDREAALARLRQVQDGLPAEKVAPDRWGMAVDLGALLVRAGEPDQAARVLEDVLPKLERAGLHRPGWYARIALAEVAMARRDPEAAAAHLRAARSRMSEGLWIPRLSQLDVMIARAQHDTARADRLLAELDQQAHRRDDTLAQLLVHSQILPGQPGVACTQAQRDALVARTGFHAARLDWLQGERARIAAQ